MVGDNSGQDDEDKESLEDAEADDDDERESFKMYDIASVRSFRATVFLPLFISRFVKMFSTGAVG
jgi:hypothetical protein